MTFSQTLYEARGLFILATLSLGVLAGIGIEIRNRKPLSFGTKKIINFGSQTTRIGTILIVIGVCLFIIFAFYWLRLLVSVRDWSLQIAPGIILLWVLFFIFLVFVIWRERKSKRKVH